MAMSMEHAAPLDTPRSESAPVLVFPGLSRRELTGLGLAALGAGLALGVLAALLLRGTPWGINAPLWTLILLAVTAGIAHRRGARLSAAAFWLGIPIALIAACVAWRDS